MINKIFDNVDETVQDIENGSMILMGGFGGAGVPYQLISGLYRRGSEALTFVSNNPGFYEEGLAELIKNGRVAKLMCSFPLSKESYVFIEKYKAGKIALELIPQGTMAERIRAGGSGIEAFYTPTGVGTEIAEGKEEKIIEGVNCLLEKAIKADFAFVKAKKADRWGNLIYNKSGRNFNPLMAMAANITIAEVDEIVEVGELDPESVVTPGIFVQRVFKKVGS
ncbi:3-oxoacid CoA-transferase subunit A [Salicibibacter halophilus]|uniref:3-oxoacid CoA-transferase subunit A n=1 Tax=Salicibibacter halophilus TaxID=2502791 RepID=A0A514LER5_9BACI|nr:3-oxoacid CoA-transferase subunit A [Salicibibacter halophilus]QDI90342.1 3-oxoacid CoA-transferase subunit A [Salicibibacter halophilus]